MSENQQEFVEDTENTENQFDIDSLLNEINELKQENAENRAFRESLMGSIAPKEDEEISDLQAEIKAISKLIDKERGKPNAQFAERLERVMFNLNDKISQLENGQTKIAGVVKTQSDSQYIATNHALANIDSELQIALDKNVGDNKYYRQAIQNAVAEKVTDIIRADSENGTNHWNQAKRNPDFVDNLINLTLLELTPKPMLEAFTEQAQEDWDPDEQEMGEIREELAEVFVDFQQTNDPEIRQIGKEIFGAINVCERRKSMTGRYFG